MTTRSVWLGVIVLQLFALDIRRAVAQTAAHTDATLEVAAGIDTRVSDTSWVVIRGPKSVWNSKGTSLACNPREEADYWILSKTRVPMNYILEADVNFSRANRKQGILLTVNGKGSSGYLLEVGQQLKLWRLQDDQISAIAEWRLGAAPAGGALPIRVMKTGATYAFWVNGILVNTIVNPSWQRTANGFTPGNEPDSDLFGFAFSRRGTVSRIRVRSIQLAQKHAGNPVLPPRGPQGSFDESQAFTAGVLEDAGTFYLYYTGIDAKDPKQEGGGFGRLGVATSPDLIHWTKYTGNPLLAPGPAGTWDSNHLQFGPVTKTPDKRYAVTYQAWDPKRSRWVGYGTAFAVNPLGPFVKYDQNPIFRTSSDPRQFDGEHIHLHTIIKEKDGTYALLYTGYSKQYGAGRVGDKGGLATSNDLIHWQKYSQNPVFPLDQPGAWDDGHVRPKGVVSFRGWYYMFYEGAHFDGKVWFDQVGMARSKDLIHWQRFPFNPIIPLDTASGRDNLVTEWPCAIVKDNKLYVFYWGGSPSNVAISIAEIPTDVLEAWGKQ